MLASFSTSCFPCAAKMTPGSWDLHVQPQKKIRTYLPYMPFALSKDSAWHSWAICSHWEQRKFSNWLAWRGCTNLYGGRSCLLSTVAWQQQERIWAKVKITFTLCGTVIADLSLFHSTTRPPGDGEGQEAWRAAVHEVSKSRPWPSNWTIKSIRFQFSKENIALKHFDIPCLLKQNQNSSRRGLPWQSSG